MIRHHWPTCRHTFLFLFNFFFEFSVIVGKETQSQDLSPVTKFCNITLLRSTTHTLVWQGCVPYAWQMIQREICTRGSIHLSTVALSKITNAIINTNVAVILHFTSCIRRIIQRFLMWGKQGHTKPAFFNTKCMLRSSQNIHRSPFAVPHNLHD